MPFHASHTPSLSTSLLLPLTVKIPEGSFLKSLVVILITDVHGLISNQGSSTYLEIKV